VLLKKVLQRKQTKKQASLPLSELGKPYPPSRWHWIASSRAMSLCVHAYLWGLGHCKCRLSNPAGKMGKLTDTVLVLHMPVYCSSLPAAVYFSESSMSYCMCFA
jgi:hypothetical protein